MSGGILIPTLLVLAIVKFALVVLWFMHLKFDDRRFARFFVMGLVRRGGAVPGRPDLVPGLPLMVLPSFHVHRRSSLVNLGALVGAYLVAAKRHERATGERLEPAAGTASSAASRCCCWAPSWPIHDLAESYLYSMHMVQHMLFTFVAAPLLLTGMPAWMWRALLRPAPVRAVWGLLTRPLVALLVANGVLFFIHWPAVVSLSVRSELAHFSLHTLLLGSAIVMWWPVLSPLPELPAAVAARVSSSTSSSSRSRRRSRRRS